MNIEEEFLKFTGNIVVFPNQKDYTGIYCIFKTKFDTEIHPEVKTKILEMEKSGYYNDHGVHHIKMVIERASWVLNCLNPVFNKSEDGFFISPYELFILLMSIQLHDTGHLIGSRSDHAKLGKSILAKFDKGDLLSTAEKKIIGDIAQAHGGKNDPIGKLEIQTNVSHHKIRPQLLAAILRLGDELAEDKTRASTFLQDINAIERTSEIFHRYSSSLDSVELTGKEIILDFYMSDEISTRQFPKIGSSGEINQFLIDEIYERTLKTFSECLYCNRFLPDGCRFTKIKVKVIILDEHHSNIITPVSYELIESGYPTILGDNIFEICESLNVGEIKKDGQYISTLVKEKNRKNEESVRG